MDSDSDSDKSYVILKEDDDLFNSGSDSDKSYILLKEDDLLNSGSDSEKSCDVLEEGNIMSSDNGSEKSCDVLEEGNIMSSNNGSEKSCDVLEEGNIMSSNNGSEKSCDVLEEGNIMSSNNGSQKSCDVLEEGNIMSSNNGSQKSCDVLEEGNIMSSNNGSEKSCDVLEEGNIMSSNNGSEKSCDVLEEGNIMSSNNGSEKSCDVLEEGNIMSSNNGSEKSCDVLEDGNIMSSNNGSEKSCDVLKQVNIMSSHNGSEKSCDVLKQVNIMSSHNGSEKSCDVLKQVNIMSSDNGSEKSCDVLKQVNLMNSDSDIDSDTDHNYRTNLNNIIYNSDYVAILKENDLIKRQQRIIHEVTSLLMISANDACMLLLKYGWCVTDVCEAWFRDPRKVCDDIGLLDADQDVKFPKHDKREVQCGICFDSVRFDETANCGCDHIICKKCWRSYVNVAINEGPGCLTLKCPEPSCGANVGPDMVKVFAEGGEKKKYDEFWLRSYVRGSKKIKWCPGPGCEYAVEFDEFNTSYDVACDCKHVFCWKCLEEAHSPADCKTVGKWEMKNMAEAENISWILANAKPCPNCKQWIERYGGCTTMTCIEPCGYMFCWLCLESTSGHTYTACGKTCKVNEDERQCELAKKSLDRYPHYYERWTANEKYRKQAIVDLHNFKKTVYREKISSQHYLPRKLTDAWLQIVECRRVLKWAYASANYNVPKAEDAKTVLFEFRLGQAEDYVERLHLCVEKELQAFIECGFKKVTNSSGAELSNLTSVARTYFQNLVRAIE